jgi:hypothetical protein
MSINNNLPGLPIGRVVLNALERLCLKVEDLGINVEEDYSETSHARFVGIFDDRTITLYPNVAPPFALWFTVAHLFGHMVQLANKSPRVDRANELVLKVGESLTTEDIQLVYDHEREAAEIGRKLIAETEADLSIEMDAAYTRFFHADFRYLINFIETGEGGVELFAKYWKREPIIPELIKPDLRNISSLKNVDFQDADIVVV